MKAPITSHILDTHSGTPAAGIKVSLQQRHEDQWRTLSEASTNADGRIDNWPDAFALRTGEYRLRFATKPYFDARDLPSFFPHVDVTFLIEELQRHYHVPLLLSAFSYSTYRGS